MLKRFLAACLFVAGLAIPTGVQQPVHAEECFMAVVCNVTPTDSECSYMFVCFG